MQSHASSRPSVNRSGQRHEWTIETADYDQGMTEIRAAVPDGRVLLGVRVER